MATVRLDLPGSRFTNEILPGGGYVRRCRVEDLTATSTLDLIFEALSALPQPNDALGPPFTDLYVARQRLIDMDCAGSKKWALVEIDYEGVDATYMGAGGGIPSDSGPTVKGITGSIYQRDVLEDVGGNAIETTFDNVTQAHRVRGFGIQQTYTFQRFESSDPQPRVDAYVGRVNSATFLGFAPRRVLCRIIRGEPNAAGANWSTRYEFDARDEADPWDITAVHDDPFFPGNPLPFGVGGAASRYFVELHPAADFNLLSLT